MGVSKLTAMVIGSNYPENIMCASGIDEGLKWGGYIYLMKDGVIHKLYVSTSHVYDSEEQAVEKMHELCTELVDWYNKEFNDD